MIGSEIIEIDRVDSTNAHVARILEKGKLAEGTIIVTRDQFAGRGQKDNDWLSEPGKNLTFTLILYPGFLPPDRQFLLNKTISLAVLDFIRYAISDQESSIQHPTSSIQHPASYIKWPNDIYLNDRKTAGILIENRIMGSAFDSSLVGIGLNVNQERFSLDLPKAGSLIQFIGREIDLKEALVSLCSFMDRRYTILQQHETGYLDREYCLNLWGFGLWREFSTGEKKLEGKILGVDDFGRLIIETRSGEIRTYNHKSIEFA